MNIIVANFSLARKKREERNARDFPLLVKLFNIFFPALLLLYADHARDTPDLATFRVVCLSRTIHAN